MPRNSDRRNLQALYPEPQALSGIAARTPTKFTVPIIRLSLLLFLPLYLVLAMAGTYLYSHFQTKTGLAGGSIAFITGMMFLGVLAIVMLGNARAIIVRNCVRPRLVQVLYIIIIVPTSFIILIQFKELYGNVTVQKILEVEAAAVYAMVLLLVVVARRLSR